MVFYEIGKDFILCNTSQGIEQMLFGIDSLQNLTKYLKLLKSRLESINYGNMGCNDFWK